MSADLKLLDAYTKDDAGTFFGRDAEIDELYRLFFRARVLVVYGPSGTGKTSLLQCGFANRLPETDWTALFIRRRRNLNASLMEAITGRPSGTNPSSERVRKAVDTLYLNSLRPVCLVFDQFEELFVLGDAAERRTFIRNLAALLRSKVQCKVVISLREDYLAQLDAFEHVIPHFLATRLRVEPMRRDQLKEVILRTAPLVNLRLERGAATAGDIIDNLSDARTGVQLAYLQIYLDRLRTEAREAASGRVSGPGRSSGLLISTALVKQAGKLGDVLAAFLDDQAGRIQKQVRAARPEAPADAVQQVLERLATLDGTKVPRTRADLDGLLQLDPDLIGEILGALEGARIVNRAAGEYELAHDSLAFRVADSRNAARKNLLRLEKIVRDQLGSFDQTSTYLNPQELALLRPYEGELSLTEQERAFLARSRTEAIYARIRKAAAYVLVATPAAALAALAVVIWTPDTAAGVSRVLVSAGLRDVALATLNPALKLHPDDVTLLLGRADAYLRKARDADKRGRESVRLEMVALAERDFEAVGRQARARANTYQLNQICWFRAVHDGDLHKALADCDAAMVPAEYYDSRGFVYLKLGVYDAALRDYDATLAAAKALDAESQPAQSLYGRALALLGTGSPEAKKAMADAIRVDPGIERTFVVDYWLDVEAIKTARPGAVAER